MMNIKAKRDIAHKTKILNHARESKNIAKTFRHFGILFILGKELMNEMARKD